MNKRTGFDTNNTYSLLFHIEISVLSLRILNKNSSITIPKFLSILQPIHVSI